MPKIKKSDIYHYRKERIIELYQSGLNISQIMEQFPDITYGKISDFLKESNLLPSTKSLKKALNRPLILEMFKTGKTINQICYELNVKATIVSAILKEQNLIKNKYYYAGKTFHDINEYLIIKKQTGINIRSDFEKGLTHSQLMQKYNVSMRAIKVFLSKK